MDSQLVVTKDTARLSKAQRAFVKHFLANHGESLAVASKAVGYTEEQGRIALRNPAIQAAIRRAFEGDLLELGSIALATARDIMINGQDTQRARVSLEIIKRAIPATKDGARDRPLAELTVAELENLLKEEGASSAARNEPAPIDSA